MIKKRFSAGVFLFADWRGTRMPPEAGRLYEQPIAGVQMPVANRALVTLPDGPGEK